VLLGAVALLGLIGLLHQECPGSSPSGLGDGLSLTPKGTQTRLAPESARRVVVRRMIGRAPGGVKRSRPRAARPVALGYSQGVSQNRLATRTGPVLSSPSPRRRRRTRESPKPCPGTSGARRPVPPFGTLAGARGPRRPILAP
jgi:hypothetical protein